MFHLPLCQVKTATKKNMCHVSFINPPYQIGSIQFGHLTIFAPQKNICTWHPEGPDCLLASSPSWQQRWMACNDWEGRENTTEISRGEVPCNSKLIWLVVSTHLKNIGQIGSFPQVGVKIKSVWNHQLATVRPWKKEWLGDNNIPQRKASCLFGRRNVKRPMRVPKSQSCTSWGW